MDATHLPFRQQNQSFITNTYKKTEQVSPLIHISRMEDFWQRAAVEHLPK